MEQNTGSSLFELQIDHNSSDFLGETARWAKFLAIVGFIFSGLMVIFAFFAGSLLAGALTRFGGGGVDPSSVGLGGFVTVIYILLALLQFFPCLFLFNFASRTKVALRSNDQEQLNRALKNLRSTFRFVGIFTIIIIGFYILVILLALIGVAFK